MSVSTTSFDIDDRAGVFWTLVADAEYWLGRVGFHLRIPVHTLSMTSRDRQTGIGDPAVGVSFRPVAHDRLHLVVGLDAHAPLGDTGAGLGLGVAAFVPRARFAWSAIRPLQVVGDVAGFVSAGPVDDAVFVEQRSDVEIRAGGGVAWVTPALRVSGTAHVTRVLAPEEAAGDVLITAGASASARLGSLWITAFGELPVGAARRFDWRAGALIGFQWGDVRSRRPSPARLIAP